MAQLSGFGGFMEGVAGGIKTRSDMDQSRQLKEYMSQRNERGAIDLQETYDARLAQWQAEGGDPAQFKTENTRYQKVQDPALLRLGKFLGGRIKGFFGGGTGAGEEGGALEGMSIATPEVQMAGPQASGATTYGIPDYADGGRVRRYADGGQVEEDTYLDDLGRNAKEFAASGFRNTIDAYQRGSQLNRQNRDYMMEEGISATERGDRARSYAGDAIGGGARVLTGFADDALGPIDEAISAGVRGIGGFFGMESGEDAAAIPAPAQAPAQAPETPTAAWDRSSSPSSWRPSCLRW
jgi:hypothetical protein